MATWNGSFLQIPKKTDSPNFGDDEIRDLREAIQERIKNEHLTYYADSTNGTASKDWLHRPGSAVAFYGTYAGTLPSARPNGEALVAGILCYDVSTQAFYVWNGSAWTAIMEQNRQVSINGTLPAGGSTNVVPVILFPYALTITKVSARVKTAPAGAAITLDLNVYNASGVLQGSLFNGTTRITIADGTYADQRTSFDAGYKILGADYYMTLDVDTVGTTTVGADLSLVISGY